MPPLTPDSPGGNAGAPLPDRLAPQTAGDLSTSPARLVMDRPPSATGAATLYSDYLAFCEGEGITPISLADWPVTVAAAATERAPLPGGLLHTFAGEHRIPVRKLDQNFAELEPLPSFSERHLEHGRSIFGTVPLSPEMEERMREEERNAGAPLAAAAIIILMTCVGFASGVIAGPAVRQLLAMVL
ncbi:hypothetical protein [Aureimonas pseudogalii]|uniref:Uncharacterized protein n=1 Tax=Aureimonas pseudogalii TaxID=1744844 RepID=A0A7W6H382_9HYPH|nr:hypothetical protein [Aureimonas pseudogalii]MBB3996902.1 hypothetical protein [Aureimonas pseudogalii]